MNMHLTRVSISETALKLSIAVSVYDDVLLEEQRIKRELARVQERLEQNARDKAKYAAIINHLQNVR